MKLYVLVIVAFVFETGVEGLAIRADLKAGLIIKGNAMIELADGRIKKLEAEKRDHEALILKTEEAKVKHLIADLEAATDDSKIKALENELNLAEQRFQLAMAKVSQGMVTRDLESDLIAKGNELIQQAEEVIKRHETEKNNHYVDIVKDNVLEVHRIIADLKAATDQAKIKHLESILVALERNLQAAITSANLHTPPTHPPHPTTVQSTISSEVQKLRLSLIAAANDLIKLADGTVKLLESENKPQLVNLVSIEESKIKKLISDLETATEEAKIKTLESELSQSEQKLQQVLAEVSNVSLVTVPTKP